MVTGLGRQVRRRSAQTWWAVLMVALLCGGSGACFLAPDSGSPAGTFVLTRIQRRPLPAPTSVTVDVNGQVFTLERLQGRLRLFEDGAFEMVSRGRSRLDGVTIDEAWHLRVGRYEAGDTAIVLAFKGFSVVGTPSPNPSSLTRTYVFVNGRDTLRGLENLANEFEYVRERSAP